MGSSSTCPRSSITRSVAVGRSPYCLTFWIRRSMVLLFQTIRSFVSSSTVVSSPFRRMVVIRKFTRSILTDCDMSTHTPHLEKGAGFLICEANKNRPDEVRSMSEDRLRTRSGEPPYGVVSDNFRWDSDTSLFIRIEDDESVQTNGHALATIRVCKGASYNNQHVVRQTECTQKSPEIVPSSQIDMGIGRLEPCGTFFQRDQIR